MPQFVAKLRTPVRVTLAGRAALEGLLSLAPSAEFHDGPETLLELLNGGDRVLPLELESGEAVALLARAAIETVEPTPGTPARLVRPEAFLVTREERVRVELAGGRVLEGVLRFELPDELNRTSDFLNGRDDFIAVDVAESVVLVNKSAIAATWLTQQSPLPIGSDARRIGDAGR